MNKILCLILVPCVLVACSRKETPQVATSPPAVTQPAEPAPPPPPVLTGESSSVALTSIGGSGVTGQLLLEGVQGGVRVTGSVTGLAPDSVHGFHIHELGDCSGTDGMKAGGHFNPQAAPHAGPDVMPRHLGDLPNLVADAGGTATVDAIIDNASLHDAAVNDLIGRSIIVHADRDDYASQPAGNSGARVACGVIL